jgi:hypothetical protein
LPDLVIGLEIAVLEHQYRAQDLGAVRASMTSPHETLAYRQSRPERNASPLGVMRTIAHAFVRTCSTKPRSVASSHTGRRGHEVRQASMTSL